MASLKLSCHFPFQRMPQLELPTSMRMYFRIIQVEVVRHLQVRFQVRWRYNKMNFRILALLAVGLISFGISDALATNQVTLDTDKGTYAGGDTVSKESACNAGDPSLIPESGRSPGEGIGYPLQYSWASRVAQLVKNPPAVQETSV